jgi:hypothetical protein
MPDTQPVAIGRALIQLAPRGFAFVADALDQMSSYLEGKDIAAIGAIAAMRIQLMRLSVNNVRGRLALDLSLPRRKHFISTKEWEALNTGEPLLRPSLHSYLPFLTPLNAKTVDSAFHGPSQLLRDAELASASYSDKFCSEASIDPRDVLAQSWDMDTDALVPAFCLFVDRTRTNPNISSGSPSPKIVLVVRGTRQLGEAMMDVAGSPQSFLGGSVHSGILHATKALALHVGPHLHKAFVSCAQENRPAEFCIIGHSFGAGVSALLAMMLLSKNGSLRVVASPSDIPTSLPLIKASIRVAAFCSPAIMSADLSIACRQWISSLFHCDDVLPRLNLRGAAALRRDFTGYDALAGV